MREDWKETTMLDACDLITCGVAARPKYVNDGVPFLSAKNVKKGRVIYDGYNCITEENHQELTKKNKPLVGDVLYTRVGSYGEAAVIEEDIEFSVFVSLTLIKPKKNLLNSYFLKHYLNSHEVKTLAKKSITSSGVGNLNVGTVRKFPILIPPIPEQQQIVALVDQAFEAIDQAKLNIEKNIENAKQMFQSKLNNIFSQKGDDWQEKALGELGQITSSKRIYKKEYVSSGIPYYRSKEIKELAHGKDISIELFIDKEKYFDIMERFGVPRKGDILLTAIGATIGEIYVLDHEEPFYFKDGNVLWLKNFNDLNSEYLKFSLMYYLDHILTIVQGSAYNALTIEKLKKYSISFPSISQQIDIVKNLNVLKTNCLRMETNYLKQINSLEELKKSILQKAFAGELTN